MTTLTEPLLASAIERTGASLEASSRPATRQDVAPLANSKWVEGAEPTTMCFGCQSEFPAGSSEFCPTCSVTLSVVHKCPKCNQLQSAQHLSCYYCGNALVIAPPVRRQAAQVYNPSHDRVRRWVRIGVGIVSPQLAVAVLIFFLFFSSWLKPKSVMGQSYVLDRASLHQQASFDAPVVTELRAHEAVEVLDCAFDAMGNHWFAVSSHGTKPEGYVLAQEISPPKAKTADGGSTALRHSLLALEDPAVLPEAVAAVDHYRDLYPDSTHVDELRWVLAEKTQRLAGRSRGRQVLLSRAKDLYAKVALGNGRFADSARTAMTQLAADAESNDSLSSQNAGTRSPSSRARSKNARRADGSGALKISVVGATASSPGSRAHQAPGN
jgi:hypothetical protein